MWAIVLRPRRRLHSQYNPSFFGISRVHIDATIALRLERCKLLWESRAAGDGPRGEGGRRSEAATPRTPEGRNGLRLRPLTAAATGPRERAPAAAAAAANPSGCGREPLNTQSESVGANAVRLGKPGRLGSRRRWLRRADGGGSGRGSSFGSAFTEGLRQAEEEAHFHPPKGRY